LRRIVMLGVVGLLALTACGEATQTASPTSATGGAVATQTIANTTASISGADLTGIKSYLLDKATALKGHTARLKAASDRYYGLAEGAKFDYATLWGNSKGEVTGIIQEARNTWMEASPGYEQIEGLVAGVPALSHYDVILDAGSSAAEDSENAVPFDLTLPDGRVLPKPGNLFGVTESTLWGTFPGYRVEGVEADYNGNGTRDFGEALPDAHVLKSGVDALDSYTGDLLAAAQAWQPAVEDAFTALVVMVPTMNEYFNSWKNSRFVAGDASEQRDFVAISRLADITGILSGLQVVYKGVSPMVRSVDVSRDEVIAQGLEDLRAFVADVHAQEKDGKRFTPEEADILGVEAQNRATAIVGQISQVAAQLNIEVEE
jgi:hypothetical protein